MPRPDAIHIAQRLFDAPLMIHERKLQVILNVLGPRIGFDQAPQIITARIDDDDPEMREASPEREGRTGVRVINIGGSLVNRGAGADGWSGLTSYEWIKSELKRAGADSKIRGVLLRLDTFGGEVSGLYQAADMIRELSAEKLVWASVDDYAYSAGYFLASQAARIGVSKTSGVGSVGVIAVHFDYSEYAKKEGIGITVVKAGARKDEYSPFKPMDEEAAARLQESVDAAYEDFVEYVAFGRKMKPEDVKATEARTYDGQQAVDIGFADSVVSFDEMLAEMVAALSPVSALKIGGTAANSTNKEVAAMAEAVQTAAVEPSPVDINAVQAEAVSQERARVAGILNHAEAEGRETLARTLALTTSMSVEEAARVLAATPKPAQSADFASAMASVANPAVGADTGSGEPSEQQLVAAILGKEGK